MGSRAVRRQPSAATSAVIWLLSRPAAGQTRRAGDRSQAGPRKVPAFLDAHVREAEDIRFPRLGTARGTRHLELSQGDGVAKRVPVVSPTPSRGGTVNVDGQTITAGGTSDGSITLGFIGAGHARSRTQETGYEH